MDTTFVDLLEDLLTRAEQAHITHQQEHGRDDNWPQFYAEYMLRVLGEDQYSLNDILMPLRAAAEAHHYYEIESGTPDAQWPRWYAEHMVDTLARERYRFWAQLESLWDA